MQVHALLSLLARPEGVEPPSVASKATAFSVTLRALTDAYCSIALLHSPRICRWILSCGAVVDAPFVYWCKPGVPFEPDDFRFSKFMLIGQGANEEERAADAALQMTQAAGFTRFVDFVPSVSGVVAGKMDGGILQPGSATLSEIYKRVLESSQVAHDAVVADLGTGDGRWLYRLARSRPDVLCLGVDVNAEALREVSYRAGRKPARGGLPNVRFIAAAIESLPGPLRAVADELWVMYPWGTLLHAVQVPEPSVRRRAAGVLKPRGLMRVAINESVLEQAAALSKLGLVPRAAQDLSAALPAGYNEAGLRVTTMRRDDVGLRSSWGARLGPGGGVHTLWVEAIRDDDGRDHGGR